MDLPKKKPEWKCVQCGRCCFDYGCMISATDEDLARWKRDGRHDILEKAKVITKGGRVIAAELWFNPMTRREYMYCPFLKKEGNRTRCLIQDTKPQYCKDYICRRHMK